MCKPITETEPGCPGDMNHDALVFKFRCQEIVSKVKRCAMRVIKYHAMINVIGLDVKTACDKRLAQAQNDGCFSLSFPCVGLRACTNSCEGKTKKAKCFEIVCDAVYHKFEVIVMIQMSTG